MRLGNLLNYVTAGGVMILALSATANAQYAGVAWSVSDATASSATLANAMAQSGNNVKVVFTASGLNFNSFGTTDYTIGTFLSSQGSVTGTPVYTGGLSAGSVANDLLYEFTGTAFFTNGQTYTVAHDDGVSLYVGGTAPSNLVLSQAGPTSATTSTYTYTGTSGNQSFTFIYGECCGAPAVFQTTLVPATTPEPGSIGMLAAALLGAGVLIRKRRQAA